MIAPRNDFRAADLVYLLLVGATLCVAMTISLWRNSASHLVPGMCFLMYAIFGYLLVMRGEPIRRPFLLGLEAMMLLFASFSLYLALRM